MKLNWGELSKGDRLYVLIPYCDSDHVIKYMYQESYVINIHEYAQHWNVRFKYTDNNGKRRRVEFSVNKNDKDKEYLSDKKRGYYSTDNTVQHGDIIISCKNKECLQEAYVNIMQSEISKIEGLIDNYRTVVSKLRQEQFKQII